MQTELVFGSGVLVGAGAVVLAVLGRYVRTAHRQHHNRPVVSVSWLSRIRRRRSQRVVMFSSEQQARDLAGEGEQDEARRPVFVRPEHRAAERPAEPTPGWAEGGRWVDLGAPREAAVRRAGGDTHRPQLRGGVIRFRRRGGGQRDG